MDLPTAEKILTKTSQKPTGIIERTKTFFRTITVEIVVIFYFLPFMSSGLSMQNLSLEKACRVNIKFNETICDGIASRNLSMYNETHEIEVQKLVATMYAWRDMSQSILPAFLLLFFGSWSDRHQKRKPCYLLPIIGSAVSTIGYLICTYFFYELPVEYCMIADAVPIALSGNWFLLYLGVYSYVSEISDVESRTVRIGAITTLFNVCTTAGIGLSGFLYAGIGYYGVFLLSLIMYSIAFVYGVFAVKENSKDHQCSENVNFIRDFFDTTHITDTFKIAFKHPDPKKRKRMYCIMILVVVISGPWYGEAAVTYLFFRYKLQWNEIDYSVFSFYESILHTIATVFSLAFFSKYLQIDDTLIGVMSSVSKILASFVYFFARTSLTFYVGAIIEVFNGTSYIAMRSIISKLVTPEELGKVNSLFGLCEALMPLVYGPMYSLVYKWTIDVLPAAFYLFGAALTLPGVIIFLWLYKEHRQDQIEEKKNAAQKEKLLEIKDPN